MKPIAFDYQRAQDVSEAARLLAGADGAAKLLAGGQSLGPMLNLRLAQPQLLVDIRAIEELRAVRESGDAVEIGACVTHAAIEDGKVADGTRGFMPAVAADIAYRAVRNRGTIGGSLCHADPAADWLSALLALDAVALVQGRGGARAIGMQAFVTGAFATALADDEVLTAIRVPRLSPHARWSYRKFCRKPGEFADAIAAIVVDPLRQHSRAVIGATSGAPRLIADAGAMLAALDASNADSCLRAAGVDGDACERRMHAAVLRRAAERIRSAP